MKDKVHKEFKQYEDMLHMPHHVSRRRPKMPIADRAAQFAPFAAVVGHETAVKEAARYTDRRKELDDTEKAIIDLQLQEIERLLPDTVEVEIIYFKPDLQKTGGEYINLVGFVSKLDVFERVIVMKDAKRIAIEEIYKITQL